MTEATPSPENTPGSAPRSTPGNPVGGASAAPQDVSKRLLRTSSMQAQRNWLSRNKRWFIPLVVGGPLLLIIISFGVTAVITLERIKASDPYRAALATVQAHPDAQQRLGGPIQGDWFAQSQYTRVDGVIQSPASVSLRVKGSRTSGNIRAHLERIDDPSAAGSLQVSAEGFVPPVVNGWRVVRMDLGVGERESGEIVVLIGDPEAPPPGAEPDAD
ncbi:MAG: cytochrome c oxidase assembly factor Coa1 family protein [Planctomycetota bacterium]